MTAHASSRLLPAAVAVAGCLLIAVVAARPEPVAVAAPFALLLVVGLAGHREPELRTTVVVGPCTLSEGDELTVTVAVAVTAGGGWVELQLDPQRCCSSWTARSAVKLQPARARPSP